MHWSRKLINRLLRYAIVVSTLLMLWKSLVLATNCSRPILVVLSSDGYSFYNLGDLFFVTNYPADPIRTGDVVVFRIEGRFIPIVHRVIRVHEREDGYVKFLTKGDGSQVDDRGLYPVGQLWLEREQIVGKVKGYLPYLGLFVILLSNLPLVDRLLSGVLA
ncbi:unnamed protein product [Adineta ricciae]|uniref:Signal peptidase complex catalytic subunit SEC11 n=1 Tax=Adineta ricciae TaxID=249248 RepID=A0A815YKF2_ADIRI|nr:unnamed protein product [Adineta ricciae]